MPLDASVIGGIADDAKVDPAADAGKALTLADLYDQNKLNKIKVNEATQNQSDMTYAKQILAGKDLSKLDDQNAAVAEITKRSPKLGMELMKGFQGQQQGKNELSSQQLALYAAKNEIIGGDLYQLKAKHDQIQAANPKATEQQIHDAMQQDVLDWAKRMQSQKLPDGSPLLNDQDRQTIAQGLSNGYSVEWVNSMVLKSQQAKAAIDQQRKDRDENRKDQDETRKEKATNAAIALGGRRADQGQERIDLAERKQKIKENQVSKGFTDSEGDLMAALAVRGVSLPAGLRSKEQQMALLSGLLRKNPDDSPDELAEKIKAGQLDFGVQKKETTTAAAQAGKIAVAQNEVLEFGQLALEASAKVPRGDFVPFNKLEQMGERNISDPALKRFYIMNNALLNAYDSLAARGGTDKEKRAENRHNAEIADSQETYAVAIQAMKDEAAGAERAAIAATRPIGAKAPAPGATNVPGGMTPPAAPATGAAPAQVLRFDAQGNPMPPGPSSSGAPAAGTGASTTTAPALDVTKYALTANDPGRNSKNWDKRADGSSKGQGFLGLLKRPDGKVSSEISVGVQIDGKEVEIPTMVPTLAQSELDWLLTHPANSRIPDSIMTKAVAHARQRISAGKSPFAQAGESPP
jgi:hypothetical protein